MNPRRQHAELEHTARLIAHEEAKERAARAARRARQNARIRNLARFHREQARDYTGWGRDRPAV